MSDDNEIIDDIENDTDDANQVDDVQQDVVQDESLKGFMSKNDWIAAGKDAKDWRDPVEFRHKGELIKIKNELRREHDDQIKNLNLLHSVRLQHEREELIRRRDDAIDVADKAEVKRLDAQISSNYQQAELVKEPQQSSKPQEIQEWEADNPWSQDPSDPRLAFANSVCSSELAKGKSLASALRAVDREIAAKFLTQSGRESQMVESSRVAGGKRESNAVVWADLKSHELEAWKTGMFNNPKDKDGGKAAFLKAVANDRKGSK